MVAELVTVRFNIRSSASIPPHNTSCGWYSSLFATASTES